MLKSVIHLELSFLQIKKYGFSIILLHLAIQFAQYPLLKMLPLLQCVFFFVFVKKKKKEIKEKIRCLQVWGLMYESSILFY